MAIKVRHKENGETYLLVGTGFGAYESARPSLWAGNWAAETESGTDEVVALCAANGKIFWAYSKDVRVLEIDGKSPAALLKS